ncbi:hypothetical protein JL720_10620 [Aureococcus anophagefferens]|nr:hypothetical protein JL720_10620 [Aureococcus anophagefferens]
MVAEGGTRKSSMHRASRVTSSTTPRRATSATPRRATTQTSGSSYTPIAGGRSSTSFSASKTRWSLRTSRHNTTPMSTGKGHRKTSEPRPVTDKAYVKASIAKLGAFLRARGYGGASTAAALGRPTGRDFEDMSCFLFTQLDARWARREPENRRAARRSSDEFRELVDAERSLADALLEIEAVAVVYGESAAKLQVVPKTAKNAGGVDLSLAVDARTAARLIAAADAGDRDDGSPAQLRAADAALATATKARDVVAPKLEELREVLADRVRDVAESRDAAQLEVERSSLEAARLKERLEDKVAGVRNLEARLAEETARAADAKARDDADEAALLHKVEARADAATATADLDDRPGARCQALDEAAAAKRAAARADKRRALGRALDDAAALAARRVARA